MKRLVLLGLAMVGLALGQERGVVLAPYGTWFACKYNAAVLGPMGLCAEGQDKGYVLGMRASSPLVVAFRYEVVAVVGGVEVHRAGVVSREGEWTNVKLDFGGEASSWVLRAEGLTISGVL